MLSGSLNLTFLIIFQRQGAQSSGPLSVQMGRRLCKRHLQKLLKLFPVDGRPISQRSDLAALYAQRAPLYARFADAVIDNNGTPEETVRKILEVLA